MLLSPPIVLTFGAIVVLLGLVALVASYVPARSAAQINMNAVAQRMSSRYRVGVTSNQPNSERLPHVPRNPRPT